MILDPLLLLRTIGQLGCLIIMLYFAYSTVDQISIGNNAGAAIPLVGAVTFGAMALGFGEFNLTAIGAKLVFSKPTVLKDLEQKRELQERNVKAELEMQESVSKKRLPQPVRR